MICRCKDIDQLDGTEAQEYASEHLQLVNVDVTRWVTEYVCPQTGRRWIESYPYPSAHGGGPPRLTAKQDRIEKG